MALGLNVPQVRLGLGLVLDLCNPVASLDLLLWDMLEELEGGGVAAQWETEATGIS